MTIAGDSGRKIGDGSANESIRIKAQIIGQLEKYLSTKNVKVDPVVAAQVATGRIAVNALSGIIKDITSDRELLLSVLMESKKFVLDPTCSWVTIRKQKERNVLILREIPTETSIEDVKKIFTAFTDLPEIKNITSEIGNNWFITFDNQDDCMAAALKLSTEGKFNGESLKVRVKANLKQAEVPSPFHSPGSPSRHFSKRSYKRSRLFNASIYSPRRSRGARPPGRPRMPYPPPMVLGSPRRRPAPVAAVASDYKGVFRQFTTEIMRDVIKRKFGATIAPKPISLDSDEVRDIVTKRPKTTVGEPMIRSGVPEMKELNLNAGGSREETRKKDKQKRKKGGGTARRGRPAGDRGPQGTRPRGQKNASRRTTRGGKK